MVYEIEFPKTDFLFLLLQDKNILHLQVQQNYFLLKFGYSEKATKFEKNLPLKIWRYWVASNFKWIFFSNFVAFSEYPNFNWSRDLLADTWLIQKQKLKLLY